MSGPAEIRVRVRPPAVEIRVVDTVGPSLATVGAQKGVPLAATGWPSAATVSQGATSGFKRQAHLSDLVDWQISGHGTFVLFGEH